MNKPETQPTSSHPSFEEALAQVRASRGNMGDQSPVMPDSWKDQEARPVSLEKLRPLLSRPNFPAAEI